MGGEKWGRGEFIQCHPRRLTAHVKSKYVLYSILTSCESFQFSSLRVKSFSLCWRENCNASICIVAVIFLTKVPFPSSVRPSYRCGLEYEVGHAILYEFPNFHIYMYWYVLICCPSSVVLAPQGLKNIQEYINDIHIQHQCCKYIIIWVQFQFTPPNDVLSIHCKECHVQQCTETWSKRVKFNVCYTTSYTTLLAVWLLDEAIMGTAH